MQNVTIIRSNNFKSNCHNCGEDTYYQVKTEDNRIISLCYECLGIKVGKTVTVDIKEY